MEKTILIYNSDKSEVLYKCPVEDLDLAYMKAQEWEDMGIDVVMEIPTITGTLASSLGVNEDDRVLFEESIIKEIEDHQD